MEMYEKHHGVESRWSTFENPAGNKGMGGMENGGMKGHAFEKFEIGERKTILDISGSGIINRMWMTLNERSAEVLRSIVIEMYWDGSKKPAVSVPLGDFFCAGLGILLPFENELFSSPEGKSLNSYVPMPFYKGAVIKIKNESQKVIKHFFYDISYVLKTFEGNEANYLHAYWNRQNPTTMGEDFMILPEINGKGRFLGTNIGVICRDYGDSWWGEGEVKIFIDGDKEFPTLVGTGAEDYIGTGWGQGVFNHRYQGCLVSDSPKGHYTFYRFHIKDPVYFDSACKVTIQQIGGTRKETLVDVDKKGMPLQVISSEVEGVFTKLHEICSGISPEDPSILRGSWLNFLRQDDVSATSYFYLDHPENNLPPIADSKERTCGLSQS